MLSKERGKVIRLARTWQKLARVGQIVTLREGATGHESTDGFTMLIEHAGA
jgi:hypothetical protein